MRKEIILRFMFVFMGVGVLTACDDDGLTSGDANYFTSSRGQFTATVTASDGSETTLFLIPGTEPGTAVVTFDGSNPRHWQSETTATVRVGTYQDDLVIPETVNVDGVTYTITGIDDEAFTGCRAYTASGVTYWNGLTSVNLPATVTSLGEGAFALTDITTVNIPDAVTTIPMGCFADCTKMTDITIPSTVKNIEAMAYYGCSGASTLVISEGTESIGEMAFFDCNKLTEVTIPSTVKTIGNRAFGGTEKKLSKIATYHVKATTPPMLEGLLYQAAEGVSPIIYVPTGSGSAYQNAAGWNQLTIVEE